MISTVAALVCCSMQTNDGPVDRVSRFLASQPSLRVTMDVEFPKHQIVLKSVYEMVRPGRQRLVMTARDGVFEMRQNSEGVISISHADKSYEQEPPLPVLALPFESAPLHYIIAYPHFIRGDGLKTFGGQNVWREIAPPAGVWKRVETVMETQSGPAAIRADIAADGRLLALGGLMPVGDGVLPVEFKNIKYETIGSVNEEIFALTVPEGYVPDLLPKRVFTLGMGDAVPLSPWRDSQSGQSVDPKKLMGRNGLAILFTSADCVPTQNGRKALGEVEKILDAKGCPLVEISIGEAKPIGNFGHRVVWDQSGKIAASLGVDATPHILIVGTNSVGISYWPGYSADTKAEMMKWATGLFVEDDEEE